MLTDTWKSRSEFRLSLQRQVSSRSFCLKATREGVAWTKSSRKTERGPHWVSWGRPGVWYLGEGKPVYTHTYTDTHTQSHIHTDAHTQIQTQKHTDTRTYTDTHIQTHIHIQTHRHRHTRTDPDIHRYTHAETHTDTHVMYIAWLFNTQEISLALVNRKEETKAQSFKKLLKFTRLEHSIGEFHLLVLLFLYEKW